MTHTHSDVERLVAAVEQLQDALAKRILAEWNAANAAAGTPNDWPAQQEWHELGTTSQASFRQMARAEAGLDRTPVFRQWLSSLTDDVPERPLAEACRNCGHMHGRAGARLIPIACSVLMCGCKAYWPVAPELLAPLPTLTDSPDAGKTEGRS